MKTTLDIPEELLRTAESKAASEGRTFPEFVSEALREKLFAEPEPTNSSGPEWLHLAGRFGGSDADKEEIARLQIRIDEEFGKVDPLE